MFSHWLCAGQSSLTAWAVRTLLRSRVRWSWKGSGSLWKEAVLLGSSDESPEGSKEQVSGRLCTAPGSPSATLNSSRNTRASLERAG